MERLPRPMRAATVAAVLVLLVVVVALASGSERPAAGGASEVGFLQTATDIAITIGITLYVLLGAVVIVLLVTSRPGAAPPMPPRRRRGPWGLLIFLAFALGLYALVAQGPAGVREAFEEWGIAFDERRRIGEDAGRGAAGAEGESADFLWPVALTVAGLVAAAVVGFVALSRRRARGLTRASAAPRVEDELAGVVETTLADLQAESDPRRSVIAAYAQLERVLGERGYPRRHYEAPFEYLGRILQGLRVRAAAALALTELFERARFSQHVVDEEMKAEAIEALEAVRADLRAAR